MYRVYHHRAAEKALARLSRKQAKKIVDKIEKVAINPFAAHPNCTKMLDLPHGYRLRIGSMRVVYEVDSISKTMIVWKIGPRGSVYKQ